MAVRSGIRVKTIVVNGINVLACPECGVAKTKRIPSYGGSFHDDMLVCIKDHTYYHNLKKGDVVLWSSGIMDEYDGEDFNHLKSKSNYIMIAQSYLNAAKKFKR